jgi:hypothetical protein
MADPTHSGVYAQVHFLHQQQNPVNHRELAIFSRHRERDARRNARASAATGILGIYAAKAGLKLGEIQKSGRETA